MTSTREGLSKCPACGIIDTPDNLIEGTCGDVVACMHRIRRRHRAQQLEAGGVDAIYAEADRLVVRAREMEQDLQGLREAVKALRGTIYQSARTYDADATIEIRNLVAKVIEEHRGDSAPEGVRWTTHVATRVMEALRRRPDLPDAGLSIFDGRHDHDILDDVARVIAPDMTDAADDPYYTGQAKAAVLVARGGPAAAELLKVWEANEPGARQQAVWDCAEALYRKVAAGQIIEVAASQRTEEVIRSRGMPWPQGGCMETQYERRGECDGELFRTTLTTYRFGRAPGSDVILCRSHYSQCVGDGEVKAGASAVTP